MSAAHVSYLAIMLLAIGVGASLLRRTQQPLRLPRWHKLGIAAGAYCGAMLGAKLPFVLADWDGLLSGAAWFSHGKTIVFGIVGGYFGVEVAKWILEVREKTGDTFAVPVASAVAIGRLGCFQAGCCYGRPTKLPWGVVFATAIDGPALRRHPTQLYEAVFHLAMALLLAWLTRRDLLRYQRLKLYLISYLGYRFLSEFVRPEPILAAGLTGYQWSAGLLIPIFVWLWRRDARRLNPAGVA